MSLKQTLWMNFMPVRLAKLAPKCRYSDFPMLCQKRMMASMNKDYNGTELYPYDESIDDAYFRYLTPEDTFIHYLTIVFFPYLLFVGTVGNIAGVLLLRRYSFDVWSTCLYMTILFPLDLIKLYVECGNQWYSHIHKEQVNLSIDTLNLSNAMCKVYSFTYSLLLHEYQWIMIAAGIEVAIATKKPLLIYNMCTRERATAIMLFISVLLISLNLHFFWTQGLLRPEDTPSIHTKVCTYINELSDQFRDYIWPIIDFFVGQVIPFVLLSAAVIIAFYQLIKSRKKDKELNTRLEKYFLDLKTLMELRKAMIWVCFVAVLELICSIWERGQLYGIIVLAPERMKLIQISLRTAMYFFMSHKFLIFYILCVRFRSDTKALLKCLCSPFVAKYRKKRSKTCTLLTEEQEFERSWSPGQGQFMMTETVENI